MLVCRGGDERYDRSHIIQEVLPAAAWIVGEYSHLLPNALTSDDGEGRTDPRFDALSKGPYHAIIQSMSSPTDAAGVIPLPMPTQAVFVQNVMKVFAAACECNARTSGNISINLNSELQCTDDELCACAGTLMNNLVVYSESVNVEVKERAFTSRQLLLAINLPSDFSTVVASSIASKCRTASSMLTYLLTPEPMKPISTKAQQRKLADGPPSPMSVEEWERGVDWGAFPFLTEETPWFDGDGNVRGSVENISFTKQQTTSNVATSRVTNIDDAASSFGGVGIAGNGSFDSAMGMRTTIPPTSHQQRVADPFYLSSIPSGRLFTTPGLVACSIDADREAYIYIIVTNKIYFMQYFVCD